LIGSALTGEANSGIVRIIQIFLANIAILLPEAAFSECLIPMLLVAPLPIFNGLNGLTLVLKVHDGVLRWTLNIEH
jgi:hypothetical protein